MSARFPFKVIDAFSLPTVQRGLLRPGETVEDGSDCPPVLPRFFFEIESWEQARTTRLSEHFTFAELTNVDCREEYLLLRRLPHFAPCALLILARYLEAFRERAGAPVFIAVNGGYRSPAHALSRDTSCHQWGTAVDIYRLGDTFLDRQKDIEKYARLAESIAPEISAKPFGHGPGESDDHLHLDIGYVNFVPKMAGSAQEQDRSK